MPKLRKRLIGDAWNRTYVWYGQRNNYIFRIYQEPKEGYFYYSIYRKTDIIYSSLEDDLTFQTAEAAADHVVSWINKSCFIIDMNLKNDKFDEFVGSINELAKQKGFMSIEEAVVVSEKGNLK